MSINLNTNQFAVQRNTYPTNRFLQKKLIDYYLYNRVFEKVQVTFFRHMMSRKWSEINVLTSSDDCVRYIILAVSSLFPKTSIVATPSRTFSTKYPNSSTSCLENACMITDLLTNNANFNLLTNTTLSWYYTITFKFNQKIYVDLKVRNLFCNFVSSEEDLNVVIQTEYSAFNTHLKLRKRIEKPTITSKNEYKNFILSHLEKYDLNRKKFDELKKDINSKRDSTSGWIFFINIHSVIDCAIYHALVIEQIPRKSLAASRQFRIHQAWADTYTLYEYLFTKYGIDLGGITTENQINQFLCNLEVLFCYSENRSDKMDLISQEIFHVKAFIEPLTYYQYSTDEMHAFSLKTLTFPYESKDALNGFQKLLQKHEGHIIDHRSIVDLVLDKYLELCYAKNSHNHFRLCIQIYELVNKEAFNLIHAQKQFKKLVLAMQNPLNDLNYSKSIPYKLFNAEFPIFVKKYYPHFRSNANYSDMHKCISKTYLKIIERLSF